MANGTPIRLIQRNGGIIELNVTTLSMDVDRKFNARPKVFSGSHRIATDSNLSRAVITLEGIITDDDAVFQTTETKATASIDFSYFVTRKEGGVKLTNSDKEDMARLFRGATNPPPFITESSNFGSALELRLSSSNDHRIRFVGTTSGTNGLASGVYWVQIHNQTDAKTASEIATLVKDTINNISAFNGDFTATLSNSPYTGEANAVVNITRTASGNDSAYPKFSNKGIGDKKFQIVTKFNNHVAGGGQSGSSAGDKVQRLWGVLNNSQDGGRGGFDGQLRGGGDYIIGVQVPFDSMLLAGASEKYSARNFFMTTGSHFLRDSERKNVTNALAAGIRFEDVKNSYTGIKGGVDKATFVRLGGEPIYQFTIIFLPADVIL